MKLFYKKKTALFFFFLSIGSVFASETYQTLSIVSDVDPILASSLNKKVCSIYDTEYVRTQANEEKKIIRLPLASYHVTFEIFKSNPGYLFSDRIVNGLENVITYFSKNRQPHPEIVRADKNAPKVAHKRGYTGEIYDVQLWCHQELENGQKNHHHFSSKRREKGAVKRIDELSSLQGKEFKNAHLVARIGTVEAIQQDWNTIVRDPEGGAFNSDFGVRNAKGLESFRVQDELKPHITLVRLEKSSKENFSTPDDINWLIKFYKKSLDAFQDDHKFKNDNKNFFIEMNSLEVRTLIEGKQTRLGTVKSLEK